MFGIAGAGVLALLARRFGAGRSTAAVVRDRHRSRPRLRSSPRSRTNAGDGTTVLTRWPAGFVTTVLLALAWASIAWIAFPDAEHGALRAVILLFCLATSASGIVSAGASRVRFYAYQIPLIIPLSLTYFVSSDHVTRLLGIAFPIYLVGMSAMHNEVLQGRHQRDASAGRAARRERTSHEGRALRLPHRSVQPGRVQRDARRRDRPVEPIGRDHRLAVLRHRPLQDHQRRVRPRDRRRGARRGRRPRSAAGSFGGLLRPARRRRVRAAPAQPRPARGRRPRRRARARRVHAARGRR